MTKKYGFIYLLISPSCGVYVGQTIRPWARRRQDYIYFSENGVKNSVNSAVRKYGMDSFMVAIIDTADNQNELNEKEIYYIARARVVGKCYNIENGGAKGKVAESTKKKIGDANRGRVRTKAAKEKMSASAKGKKISDETKRKLSEAGKGHKHSEETKKKISEVLKGGSWGKHSEESKNKMSEAAKGRKMSPESIEKTRQANLGRKHSDEMKRKVSAARKGKKKSDATKANMRAAWVIRKANQLVK